MMHLNTKAPSLTNARIQILPLRKFSVEFPSFLTLLHFFTFQALTLVTFHYPSSTCIFQLNRPSYATHFVKAATSATNATLLASDAAALLSLKAISTIDEEDLYYSEGNLDDWVDPTLVCSDWSGVTCGLSSSGVQRVLHVNLSSFALSGNFSSGEAVNLAPLDALESLDISGNSYSGPFPPFLNSSTASFPALKKLILTENPLSREPPLSLLLLVENFPSLQVLDLSSTGLTLTNVSFLANLTALTFLDLSAVPVNASLPAALGGLQNLTTLRLAQCGITGNLQEVPVADLASLRELVLSQNAFEGQLSASWLASLPTGLETLILDNNEGLTAGGGGLPQGTDSWPPSLSYLDLSRTGLAGPIPASIGSLQNLTTLKLRGNSLSGAIPAQLSGNASSSSSSKLTFLDLGVNNLTGAIPPSLGLAPLTFLDLGTNALSGNLSALLAALCGKETAGASLAALTSLDLHDNLLEGGLPYSLALCASLATIDLSGNRLTGSIPPVLPEASQKLLLGGNRFTGDLPVALFRLQGLEELNVSGNFLEGALLASLNCSSQPLLGVLDASSNLLTGVLPTGLSQCSLSILDLSGNAFEGSIPEPWGLWPTLTELRLGGNGANLMGELPEPSDWSALQVLDVSRNALSGSLPSLAAAPALLTLNLSRNTFSGTIPEALWNLTALQSLDLGFNRFSGALNPYATNATAVGVQGSLTLLGLEGNRLQGSVPWAAIGRGAPSLQDFRIGSNLFSGPLVNLTASSNASSSRTSNSSSSSSFFPSLTRLDASNNGFTGALPPAITNMTTLTFLDLSMNSLGGPLPASLPIALTSLDLSLNFFTGPLNAALLAPLTLLTFLDLRGNDLEGPLPDPLPPSLSFLNVSSNNFSGAIPSLPAAVGASSFLENPLLCGPPLPATCPGVEGPVSSPSGDEGGRGGGGGLTGRQVAGIAAGSAALFVLVCLCLLFLCLCRRRRRQRRELGKLAANGGATGGSKGAEGRFGAGEVFTVSGEGKLVLFSRVPFVFGIEDVVAAVGGFREDGGGCCLGRGGFGSVYKASLADGRLVLAVKRLSKGSSQGEKEFLAETQSLSTICHRHLVSLLATYSDPVSHERLLLYNYLPGGNLLSAINKGCDWSMRLRAATGAARGLKYLHHSCDPYIVHRDIKPENILLDENNEAYVADFGLAVMVDLEATHASTRLPFGTIGYMAPEYVNRRQASRKSDVYAFGIVLLQLVTGKSPKDPAVKNVGLKKWAQKHPFADVVDPILDWSGDLKEVILGVLRLGFVCTDVNPSKRPTMEDVEQTLENLDEFALRVKVGIKAAEDGKGKSLD